MRIPTGVSVLAVFFIVLGFLGIIWGFVLIGMGGLSWLVGLVTVTDTAEAWAGGALWRGILDMVTGMGKIAAGFGLLSGYYWAWLLSVILSVIWFIGPLLGLLRGSMFSLFGLILPGIILYYLLTPAVRRAFDRAATF